MATSIFGRSYNLTRLFVPPRIRSPNYLLIRYISDTNHGPNEKEPVNTPKSVPVSTAIQLIRDGYAFLDVRTLEEFKDGHPTGAINIAYMSQTESGMSEWEKVSYGCH
ncbi:hypothetical protein RND81_01G004500 [Saponaria officinalis]|uniref:Rhodanese domain-containing protein n=1 Tax=Saponaria officinalis TaxID=3572 RepID=A0AAW1N500_SAPOF